MLLIDPLHKSAPDWRGERPLPFLSIRCLDLGVGVFGSSLPNCMGLGVVKLCGAMVSPALLSQCTRRPYFISLSCSVLFLLSCLSKSVYLSIFVFSRLQ